MHHNCLISRSEVNFDQLFLSLFIKIYTRHQEWYARIQKLSLMIHDWRVLGIIMRLSIWQMQWRVHLRAVLKLWGKVLWTSCVVEAEHTGCQVTRKLQPGVIASVKWASIWWYLRTQYIAKSSSLVSRFVGLSATMEMIKILHYKLRMTRVPIEALC